ncbi:sensor histidine kinase [Paenibacillus sp. FSL H7-0331]|uniref:sensor histidine kinase n=1 Tax=Paenibacillus sp. FSL H7-0331 TaxID=1920421 RepID=UPI00096CE9E5|nr:cache domain-containing protein [Paenibacillus sp. FSL H7-0331]OMF06999.1 hypothetical protein BK127_30725 [Paenibacillus sp. FSL H7-0331]
MGFRTIQGKIFVSMFFFLIIPFCLTFFYLDKPLEKTIESKIGTSIQDALNLVSLNIDNTLEQMLNSITAISLDQNILSMLKKPSQYTDYEKFRISNNMMKTLHNSYLINTENYLTFMDFSGGLYTSWYAMPGKYEQLKSTSWYPDILNSKDRFLWIYQPDNYTFTDKRPLISVAKLIRDTSSNDNIGIVMISIVESDIRKILMQLEGEVFLIDKNGIVLSHAEPSFFRKDLSGEPYIQKVIKTEKGQMIDEINNKKMIVSYRTIHKTDWKIVQLIPYDTVFKEIFNIRKANIFIVGVIFLVFLLISISISFRISKPLKLLKKKMADIDNQDSSDMIDVKGTDEIASLIHTYNKMIIRIKDLLDRLKMEYKQKEDMRFRALQSQINPHFILNTLNNIKWMAYIRKDHEVAEMLSCMAVILEGSIGRDEDIITLKQEIAYIHNYVILQKIKYNELLSIIYDIPEDLLQCEVIKFILQPIVENSIYHGIDQMKGKGVIHIAATRLDHQLVIQIKDNGLGIDPVKLEEIRYSFTSKQDVRKINRVGIRNVHDRIQLQYGKKYGITIHSERFAGTIVEIVLPADVRKEEKAYVEDIDR